MRRALWTAGLLVAWVVGVTLYVVALYAVLEYRDRPPTNDRGPIAVSSIVVVASFLGFLLLRLWNARIAFSDEVEPPDNAL